MCKVLCIMQILVECASLVFWCWKAPCWISCACATTLRLLCTPAAACKLIHERDGYASYSHVWGSAHRGRGYS